jgi:hypothetical protein
MNLWKPIALVAVVGLGTSLTMQFAPNALARGSECKGQNNMQDALDGLKLARGFLEHAEHNKGGWRVDAIKVTDNAIADTNRGCAFALGEIGPADRK